MIKFKAASKSFNGHNVFDNISFEIQDHERVAIMGPSGSGKTTLLRLMSGILQPDSGTIEISTARIGYIFQDHRLLPWRSAQDNIALALRAQGISKQEAAAKAKYWMDRLGLKNYYNYYPGQLSGGMIQRVSIARAFAIEPEMMLMDEPFSSLDAYLAEALFQDLRQVLNDFRSTTVYVTHNPVEAISLARRIFQISSGTIIETAVTDRKAMIRDHLMERMKGFGLEY